MNWNNLQHQQSTPKLLPPTAFERTINTTSSTSNNNDISAQNTSGNTTCGPNNTNLLSPNVQATLNDLQQQQQQKYALTQLVFELDKLKFEINNLKQENDLLRNKNHDYIEQFQTYQDMNTTSASAGEQQHSTSSQYHYSSSQQQQQPSYMHHHHTHHQINISTLEEIIHKQSNEIKYLKLELNNEKSQNINLKQNYEKELNRNLAELDSKLKENTILNENLSKLKQTYEVNLNEEKSKLTNLINELNQLKDSYEVKINSINVTNEKQIENKNERIQTLENELKSLKLNLDLLNKSSAKFQEMNHLEEKYERKLSENELLSKEMDALKIRLNSLNEILMLQEAQLQADFGVSSVASGSGGINLNEPSPNSKYKARHNLLTKWRLKVFDLLVKNKTIELVSKQDRNEFKKNFKHLNEKLENAYNQNKIYENLLEDKKAQLYVTIQENNKLSENLIKFSGENASLKDTNEKNLQKTNDLKQFIDNFTKNYFKIEDSFKMASKKLINLEQRVEFAKGRLDVVKALQVHKETHYKDELKRLMNITQNISSIHSLDANMPSLNNNNDAQQQQQQQFHSSTQIESNDVNGQNNNNNNQLLKQELEKVINERNMLATKLQNDMNLMDERLNKMKFDYESVITNLSEKIQLYETDINLKANEIDKFKSEYVEKESLIKSLNLKYEQLNEQFEQFKKQLESDFNKQFKLKEEMFIEKVTKMESSLNEARREQAKAIVMMRQMERTSAREKERMEKLYKDTEVYYKTNIDRLQMKIISLEKERNILMNTIRQNGINLNMAEYNVLAAATAALTQQISYLPPPTASSVASSQHTQVSSKISNNEVEIGKWLENNEQLSDKNQTSNTSIWFDNTKDEQQLNENSKLTENNEILSQIRKIMGDLELSDAEEDDDETGNEVQVEDDERLIDRNNLTEEDNNENNNNNELEHVIDGSEITN